MNVTRLLVLLHFCLLASASAQEPSPSSRGVSRTWSKLDDAALVGALRAGGQVLVFRHFATDWTQSDARPTDMNDRTKQRNLSELGRADAADVKRSLAALKIAAGEVLSSPMARTRDSAELALGRVETTPDLLSGKPEEFRRRLNAAPPAGTNHFLFTHQLTIRGALDVQLNEVEEGNCLVLAPGGEIIAHLAPRDWLRLAKLQPAGPATVMLESATVFLRSLSDEQRTKAQARFDDPARTDWNAEPRPDRKGIALRDLTPEQRTSALRLLDSALSGSGARTARELMAREPILTYPRNGARVGPEQFFVTIFGVPDPVQPWSWRFEGHHLSVNLTLEKGGIVSALPVFFGAHPARVEGGAALYAEEEAIARALIASMTDEQRNAGAPSSATIPFAMTTRGRRQTVHDAADGVALATFSPEQLEKAHALFRRFVDRLHPELADAVLEKFKASADLRFAWSGEAGAEQPMGFRLHGPTLHLELLHSLSDPNHVHTMLRSIGSDFGDDGLSAATVTSTTRPPPTSARPPGAPDAAPLATSERRTPGAMPTVDETFQRLDANGDDKLSREEIPEALRERLLRADADGDGFITKPELTEARRRTGIQ